jgi:invasion protein IalB
VPHRTETVTFDDWSATCQDFVEGPKKRTCSAQLQVQQSGSAQIVLTWRVFINDGKQFVSVLQVPTGVMIVPGVELHLDKAASRKIGFESCEPARCTAGTVMDGAFVKEATAATTASVTLQAVNNNAVQIGFSMKGFDKASAHLRANGR